MKRAEYAKRPQSALKGNIAEIIGEQFALIEKSDVPLTFQTIVDAARPKDSPLHRLFEWDDKIAGEKYRLQRARYYLNNYLLVREDGDPVRPMYSVTMITNSTPNGERAYHRREVITSDDAAMDQVLCRIYSQIRASIRDVEAFKANKSDPWWSELVKAFRNGVPKAVLRKNGSQP